LKGGLSDAWTHGQAFNKLKFQVAVFFINGGDNSPGLRGFNFLTLPLQMPPAKL